MPDGSAHARRVCMQPPIHAHLSGGLYWLEPTSLFSSMTASLCLSNSSVSLSLGNRSRTKPLGSLDDVCFLSPNSRKAVEILSGGSKAQSGAGLALQRLHYSACLRPWRRNDIMQYVGGIMLTCYDLFFLPRCCIMKRMKTYRSSRQGACARRFQQVYKHGLTAESACCLWVHGQIGQVLRAHPHLGVNVVVLSSRGLFLEKINPVFPLTLVGRAPAHFNHTPTNPHHQSTWL